MNSLCCIQPCLNKVTLPAAMAIRYDLASATCHALLNKDVMSTVTSMSSYIFTWSLYCHCHVTSVSPRMISVFQMYRPL